MRHVRCCGLVVLAGWAIIAAGCKREEPPIQRLTMRLDQTGMVETLPEFRSIAAMTATETSTWFVKIAAPVGVVNEVAEPVKTFIASIGFDQANEPEFVLPEKWWVSRSHPDRFLTVMIPMQSGDPAEVAFTRLSGNQDLLMNVNRWRRQISMPPSESVEGQLEAIPSPGGEWNLFDQTGLWNPNGVMGTAAQTTGGAKQAANSLPNDATQAIAEAIPTPKDFARDPDSSFVVASFRRETVDGKVRLSVSELPAELNSWETSVASWISEAEITGLDQAAIEKRTTMLTVGEFPARKLDLLVDNNESAKAVIGVRIECGEQAVYVKLSGDRAAVQANAAVVEMVYVSLSLQGDTKPDVGAGENESTDKADQ